MKLPVPYYSQFIDIEDRFWMLRGCGIISLKMIAEFFGKETEPIVTLANEAKDRGGYDMNNGWVHDYLVTKASELGLQAHRKEGITNLDEIIASLNNGNPVIVSVEKRVLEQTRFHMLVLVGYEAAGSSSEDTNSSELKTNGYFFYHEPESTDREKGAFRKCNVETFLEYFRGKAIFVSK